MATKCTHAATSHEAHIEHDSKVIPSGFGAELRVRKEGMLPSGATGRHSSRALTWANDAASTSTRSPAAPSACNDSQRMYTRFTVLALRCCRAIFAKAQVKANPACTSPCERWRSANAPGNGINGCVHDGDALRCGRTRGCCHSSTSHLWY